MNSTFNNSDFWNLYNRLSGFDYDEEGETVVWLDEHIPDKLIDELAKDFNVRTHNYQGVFDERFDGTDLEGKEFEGTERYVQFEFDFPDFQLLIEFNADFNGCSIHLYLIHNDEDILLAWWDCARWHPYCLRYEELNLLLAYINANNTVWKNSKIPLLLLKRFVGFGKNDTVQKAALEQRAEKVLNELGIENAEELALCGFKEKYNWTESDLGWEFTAKYSCYSLRNKPHLNSKEGKFPFELWHKLIAELGNS